MRVTYVEDILFVFKLPLYVDIVTYVSHFRRDGGGKEKERE